MTRLDPHPFDALSIPLPGVHLVDASAGTGKTFNLALLVLRVLLEGEWRPRERENPLRHILALTYTRAATAELGERIRRFIRRSLDLWDTPVEAIPDPAEPVARLTLRARSVEGARARRLVLESALAGFDEAAVCTIHGFCQRVLREHAFESRVRFDAELVADQASLVREIVLDFWRQNLNPAARIVVEVLLKHQKVSVDALVEFLGQALNHPQLAVRGPDWDPAALEKAWADICTEWANDWQEIVEKVISGLTKAERKPPGGPEARKAFFTARFAEGLENCQPSWDRLEKFDRPTCPPHRFRETVRVFLKIANGAQSAFQKSLWNFSRRELALRKRQSGVMHYSDLLEQLHQALEGREGAEALREALRGRYRAVFIDEFQDTDSLQYAIFRILFGDGQVPLFYIGDPKQAIYGFRGGDIHTYLYAARDARCRRHSLTANRRSTSAFVEACNRLYDFSGRPNPSPATGPFRLEGIDYTPVRAEGPRAGQTIWQGDVPAVPLVIWEDHSDKPLGVTEATVRVVRVVAGEIAKLVDGSCRIGDKTLTPGDVAVLVGSHREGAMVRRALAALAVPAVEGRSGSVFSSPEAVELWQVLAAVAAPAAGARLRGALLTRLLGETVPALGAFESSPEAWEAWLLRFQQWRQLWTERGFGALAGALQAEGAVGTRLLAGEGGPRRLTNFLHLLDLIQARGRHVTQGPAETVDLLRRWIAESDQGKAEDEEIQLRLETDDARVRIQTIHAAKGLEFPVVFCPFLYGDEGVTGKEPFAVHTPAATASPDGAAGPPQRWLVLPDLADPDGEALRTAAAEERLAEALRRFYVALTRAVYRAYLFAGPLSFYSKPLENSAHHHMLRDAALRLSGAPELVALEPLPSPLPPPPGRRAPAASEAVGAPRRFAGHIDRSWGVYSFTRLMRGHTTAAPEFPGVLPAREGPAQPRADIGGFPRGAHPGQALHAILEEVPFDASLDTLEQTAARVLTRHGLAGGAGETAWAPIVARHLAGVLTTELTAGEDRFRLCDIPAADRLSEMPFHFHLGRVSPAAVREAAGLPSDPGGEADIRGLMSGFIDAVFRFRDRYFLLDWKSNHLGSEPADYVPAALSEAMRQHGYPLQLSLYTVALHRHLAARLRSGYDYDRQVGGVFYLFLRGVRPGGDTGVFFHRPPAESVRRLTALLEG